jgi:hypothetical protein
MHSLITATTLLVLFAWAKDQVPPLSLDVSTLGFVSESE